MMARVLMIAQSIYSTDPRVRREAEALASHGYEVEVLCLRASREPETQVVQGVRVHGLDLERQQAGKLRYFFEYGVFLAWAAQRAATLSWTNRYQIVQVHNLPDTLVLSALLPRLLGARVVFDAHESMPESLMVKYGWGLDDRRTQVAITLSKLCLKMADHVLVVHEPMRQLFLARGLPMARMTVVMNRPDERIFTPSAEDGPGAEHNGSFVLVYAGTIAERYGLQTVLRSMPLIAAEVPNLELRLVGKGDFLGSLKTLARELHIEQMVSFEDPLPVDRIAEVYRCADVGLSPIENRTFGEISFSTKVAEYLAVGLPAVVARTPVMQQYYDESEVAFFSPGDHQDLARRVLALYRDRSLRQRLIDTGRKRSQTDGWQQEKISYLGAMKRLA